MTVAVYLLPLISLLVGCWALALGTRLRVIDHPGYLHKTHDRPTPLVGGFAIALPLLVFCGHFKVYDGIHGDRSGSTVCLVAMG